MTRSATSSRTSTRSPSTTRTSSHTASVTAKPKGPPSQSPTAPPAPWALAGTAAALGASVAPPIALTAGTVDQAGAAWSPILVHANRFRVSFTFYIDDAGDFGDGLTFVLQNDPRGASAVGGAGGDLGYAGITPSAAFRFDTFDGGPSNTAGFLSNGVIGSDGGEYSGSQVLDWTSGDTFAVNITYTQDTTNLTIIVRELVAGGDSVTYNTVALDLYAILGCTSGGVTCSAWFGFTGACGGNYERHVVSSFQCEWRPSLSVCKPRSERWTAPAEA